MFPLKCHMGCLSVIVCYRITHLRLCNKGFCNKKGVLLPWLVRLSGFSAGLRTKGSLVRFPVRTHAWIVGQVPSYGRARGNHTPSLSLSLPLFLKINKIFFLWGRYLCRTLNIGFLSVPGTEQGFEPGSASPRSTLSHTQRRLGSRGSSPRLCKPSPALLLEAGGGQRRDVRRLHQQSPAPLRPQFPVRQ